MSECTRVYEEGVRINVNINRYN